MLKKLNKIKKNIVNTIDFKKISSNKKKHKKNRQGQAIYFTFFIIFLTISFIINGYFTFLKSHRQQYKQYAQNISHQFQGFLSYSQLLLNSVNYEIAKSKSFGEQIVDILSSIDRIRYQNNFANQIFIDGMLYWVDSNKYLIASSAGKVVKPIDLSSRDYLEKTQLNPWQLQVGKSVVGALSGQNILPFAVGAFGENGHHLGTAVLSVRIENLVNKLNYNLPSFSDKTFFSIYNDEGKLVLSSNKSMLSDDDNVVDNEDFDNFKNINLNKNFNLFETNSYSLIGEEIQDYSYTILIGVLNKKILSDLLLHLTPLFTILFFQLVGLFLLYRKR